MKSLLTIEKALSKAQKVEPIGSFLDHGTGQGGLVQLIKNNEHLKIEANGYDPCVAQFSEKPSQTFDVVSSIDVLEHISRENLSNALFEISKLNRKFFFFVLICCQHQKTFGREKYSNFTRTTRMVGTTDQILFSNNELH